MVNKKEAWKNNEQQGVLNKNEIIDLLKKSPDNREALIITPLLNRNKQIEGVGIDLRLSNHFIIFSPEQLSSLDVKNIDSNQIRKYQKNIVVPFHKPFILHPKTLVLGSTLEYISMPNNTEGKLEGRSSWARHGLIIATACAIDPGFKGTITLELTNLGELPIYLYPGIRLTKLILSKTTSKSEYLAKSKKYFCQIGPEFSKVHEDKELKIFTNNLEKLISCPNKKCDFQTTDNIYKFCPLCGSEFNPE